MTINRVQGTGFAQIANTALRDKRLSFRARGVLAMVLSYSGEWESPRDWLESMSDKDGREAIQSALNELTELGYRTVVKEQNDSGQWRTEAHWVHTPGTDITEGRVSRPPGKPSVGEPVLLPEHHLQNTDYLPQSASPPPSRALAFSSLTADPKPATTKRKAAHPLPEGYQPDDALVAWTKQNAPDIDAKVEWANFCDDALAKDKRMVDWRRAWMTWARNAQKWMKERAHRRTTQRVAESAMPDWTSHDKPIDYKAAYEALEANTPLEGDPHD